jgi:hypothetical protein
MVITVLRHGEEVPNEYGKTGKITVVTDGGE